MEIIESGCLSAQKIMEKDAWLLDQLDEESPCLLHLYEWETPSLTYGYFTKLADHIDVSALNSAGIEAAVRPTGGGIIFHLSDLAFSVLIPNHHPSLSTNTLENYAYINQQVAQIIDSYIESSKTSLVPVDKKCFGATGCSPFCMAYPTVYDVVIGGRKVGGAAQRRTKKGLLHQASISLSLPPLELLKKIIKNGDNVMEAMQEHSYCLLTADVRAIELEKARSDLRQMLREQIFKK